MGIWRNTKRCVDTIAHLLSYIKRPAPTASSEKPVLRVLVLTFGLYCATIARDIFFLAACPNAIRVLYRDIPDMPSSNIWKFPIFSKILLRSPFECGNSRVEKFENFLDFLKVDMPHALEKLSIIGKMGVCCVILAVLLP